MFSNFAKTFKKNENDIKIPKEIIEALNNKLPDGLKYKYIKKGVCGITPTSDMTFHIKPKLPDDFKGQSAEDLLEFMYRTQHEIECSPDEDGFADVNGFKLKIDDFVKFPLYEGNLTTSVFVIKPEPFKKFKISLEGNGIKKDIWIKRQPHPNMFKSFFKNDSDNDALKITYIIDEKNWRIKYNFNIDIERSKNIKDILDITKLFYALLRGKFKINGVELSAYIKTKSFNKKENKAMKQTIRFWKKILQIENLVDTKFIPSFPITNTDALLIEKLYRTLVEKKPYREYGTIGNISTSKNDNIEQQAIKGASGIAFQFSKDETIGVFGREVPLHTIIGIFNIKVIDIKEDKDDSNRLQFIMEPNDKKKSYISVLHFLDKCELDNKSILETLREADILQLD